MCVTEVTITLMRVKLHFFLLLLSLPVLAGAITMLLTDRNYIFWSRRRGGPYFIPTFILIFWAFKKYLWVPTNFAICWNSCKHSGTPTFGCCNNPRLIQPISRKQKLQESIPFNKNCKMIKRKLWATFSPKGLNHHTLTGSSETVRKNSSLSVSSKHQHQQECAGSSPSQMSRQH